MNNTKDSEIPNFGDTLESIKHIGHIENGRLVCNSDCPSKTHTRSETPKIEWEKQLKEVLTEQAKVAYKMMQIMGVDSEKMAVAVLLPNLHTSMHELVRTLLQQQIQEDIKRMEVNENTSDGYHTFKELYELRLLYNAHLFNEWSKQGMYNVHKSQRHADGELCFGRTDYFIVVATLPTGQISNHYPMSDWDLFQCEAVEKAKAEWDGHTSKDVATRLRDTLISYKKDQLTK